MQIDNLSHPFGAFFFVIAVNEVESSIKNSRYQINRLDDVRYKHLLTFVCQERKVNLFPFFMLDQARQVFCFSKKERESNTPVNLGNWQILSFLSVSWKVLP